MVEKYKVPVYPAQEDNKNTSPKQNTNLNTPKRDQDATEYEPFTIDVTLKSLANNKQNDNTTTYYLLHKKWLNGLKTSNEGSRTGRKSSISKNSAIQSQMDTLVTLTPSNYEQIAFKL